VADFNFAGEVIAKASLVGGYSGGFPGLSEANRHTLLFLRQSPFTDLLPACFATYPGFQDVLP